MSRDSYEITENNTRERDEMQCPTCFEYRLVADETKIEQFSGKRDELIYATKCSNEACPNGRIDPSEIRKQMPDDSFIVGFAKDYGIVYTLIVMFILFGLMGSGLYLSGLFAPPQPAEIDGIVYGESEPISGVEIYINDTKVLTNSEGWFDAGKIEPGKHKIRIIPPEKSKYGAPKPILIRVTDKDFIVITGQEYIGNNPFSITLPKKHRIDITGQTTKGKLQVKYDNTVNARNTKLTIAGAGIGTGRQSVVINKGETRRIISPGGAKNQTVTVTAPVREIENNISKQGTSSVSLDGNLKPEDVRLVFNKPYPNGVEVGSTILCKKSDLEQTGGVCRIPNEEYGEILAVSFSESYDKSYSVRYTSRFVANEVVLETSDSRSFIRPDNPNGSWTKTKNVSLLNDLEEDVTLIVPRVGSVRPNATAEIGFDRGTPPSKKPRIIIKTDDGEIHRHTVPSENLSDEGYLIESYTYEISPDRLSEGTNSIFVTSDNNGLLFVRYESGSIVKQNVSITDVEDVP